MVWVGCEGKQFPRVPGERAYSGEPRDTPGAPTSCTSDCRNGWQCAGNVPAMCRTAMHIPLLDVLRRVGRRSAAGRYTP